MNQLRRCFCVCYGLTLFSLLSCASAPPVTEKAIELSGQGTPANAGSSDMDNVSSRKVLSLDLSTIPEQLMLSGGPVILSPEVVYTDQSRDGQVNISVDDPSILSLKDGRVTPLKPGKVTLFFYATYDSNVRRNKTLVVTTQSVTAVEPPTRATPVPQTSSTVPVSVSLVSSQEQKLYQPYFLKHYAVGMKWTYALTLEGITVSAYQASLPETLNLGWGMVLEDFAEKGLELAIFDYLDAHEEVGTYTIEVLDVSEDSVLLQTELQSNIPGIPGQALQQKRYTPENIAEIYVGGGMVSSLPDRRRTVLNNPLTFRESYHTGSSTRYLTDEMKTSATLSTSFSDREESLTWVNNQVGLVRKEMRQYGSQGNMLGVQTYLALQLVDLQGFEEKEGD